MTIETTILDFQLSNTFEQYESHMNDEEQQSMFKEMGVKTFYIGKSLDDPQRATVIFQGPENVLYDICLLYTSPSPRDRTRSRMPSSA